MGTVTGFLRDQNHGIHRQVRPWQGFPIWIDRINRFIENDQESVSNIIKARNSKKWFLNLRLEAKRRMENSGIRVLVNDYCTFKDKELFFSYRRNKSKARMITVVWRTNED